ncbi:MAG TPA: nitrous oxide reductase family maturation protein NosD [Bacillota bacterium]|nr:nitrous oxide reductase family maturation protein NosD [Bacillota bacterium]
MKRLLGLLLGTALVSLWCPSAGAQEQLQDMIRQAKENDVLILPNGVFQGNIVIDKPITIKGSGQTVIEGDGTGNVISITAPHVTLENLAVKHGGLSMSSQEEFSGVKVTASHTLIKDLHVSDVYHGVYLKNADNNEVNHVTIEGMGDKIVASQGNGIQIIHANNNKIVGNIIAHTRDGIAFDYSEGNITQKNEISKTRYGLHYMYSDRNTFDQNIFHNNNGGAAIMTSKDIVLSGNQFLFHDGSQAFGILLKSAQSVKIENNYFFENLRGIYADDSVESHVAGNEFVHNRIGIELWSSATYQTFSQNTFTKNTIPFITVGVGETNRWSEDGKGNEWGNEFPLLDLDQDGVGDTPLEFKSSIPKLIQNNELIYLFLTSPAISIYEKIQQFLGQQDVMFTDPFPLMEKQKPISNSGWYISVLIIGMGIGWFILRRRKRRA